MVQVNVLQVSASDAKHHDRDASDGQRYINREGQERDEHLPPLAAEHAAGAQRVENAEESSEQRGGQYLRRVSHHYSIGCRQTDRLFSERQDTRDDAREDRKHERGANPEGVTRRVTVAAAQVIPDPDGYDHGKHRVDGAGPHHGSR